MKRSFMFQTGLVMAGVSLLVLANAGCGLFSKSKETPPAEVAAPPAPPPPLAHPALAPTASRSSSARITDEETLNKLVQGKTTKAEVRELFGIPQEVVLSPGTETFIYYRDKSAGLIFRTTERVEMLTIRFDAEGTLKQFEYRYSGK